jgi:hypothetical protein
MEVKTEHGSAWVDEKVTIQWDTDAGLLIVKLENGEKFVCTEFYHTEDK